MLDSFKNMIGILHLRQGADEEGCSRPVGRPTRDWILICLICATLLFAGVLFDGWMYFSVSGDLAASPTSVSTPSGPSQTELQKLLAHYEVLANEYQTLLSTKPAVVDPAKAK